jgi:hypothetical protein
MSKDSKDAEIQILPTFGKYFNVPKQDSYTLSEIGTEKVRVRLNIKMTKELREKTEHILIDSPNDKHKRGFDEIKLGDNEQSFEFFVNPSAINEKWNIKFVSNINGRKLRSKQIINSFDIIHSIDIIFPSIKILGDNTLCGICHEDVKTNDKFVSECKHLFHISCVFSYLKHINKLCKCGDCPSLVIFKCFKCPICKSEIHEGVIHAFNGTCYEFYE